MSISCEEAIETDWGIPAAITRAILDRRFAVAPCDTHAVARRFLPFAPDITGFLGAAHAGIGELRLACEVDGAIRFDPIAAETPTVAAPRAGEWYMLRALADHPATAPRYRAFCDALGKDDQANVTAYAHGEGVHAPRHTDLAGGLVFMLDGCREWRVEPPLARGDGIFSPLHCGGWGSGFNSAVPVVETAADCVLYIPGGWWHETRSLTPSLTFRVGIAERTVARPR
ncbi:JmjC domain-containing protein [Sphingomonas sp. M1-B02]|uniref:JmjC domain-containing protein n=1 Tax=Sphingomonas sp. M1-B02 TaxID=3114300 RepID=UPI002240D4B3|nr:cupin domain-containing protein [Sphingomonas sp. S6-11]UZK65875.1 cupin domain-containing protein [Sphingomonas sp. S6-11]